MVSCSCAAVIPAPSNVRVVRHGDHHSVESWSRVAPHPASAPRLRTPTSSVGWMPSSLAQVWRIVPIGRFTPVGARPVAVVPVAVVHVAARPVAQGGRSDHPLVCLSFSMASCPPRPPSADGPPSTTPVRGHGPHHAHRSPRRAVSASTFQACPSVNRPSVHSVESPMFGDVESSGYLIPECGERLRRDRRPREK